MPNVKLWFQINLLALLIVLVSVILIRTYSEPNLASAEIATARDWIGLYAIASQPPPPAPTIPATWTTQAVTNISNFYSNYDVALRNEPIDWKYVGDSAVTTSECVQTPSSPRLAGSCLRTASNPNGALKFPALARPGAYEVRLYANDSFMMLDKSEPLWAPPSLCPGPRCAVSPAPCTGNSCPNTGIAGGGCQGPEDPYVNVTWGSMVGVQNMTLRRFACTLAGSTVTCSATPDLTVNLDNTASSYRDDTVAISSYYKYTLQAFTYAEDQSNPINYSFDEATTNSTSAGVVGTSDCVPAWIQTSGGDVHSNSDIDASGGP